MLIAGALAGHAFFFMGVFLVLIAGTLAGHALFVFFGVVVHKDSNW